MAPSTSAASGEGSAGAAPTTSILDKRTVPPLGMTGPQFQEAGLSVITEIEKYYSTISTRDVVPSIEPGYLRKLLPASPPQQGESWSSIEKDIERAIMPGMTHWQSPKFMAFFSASSTYPGMLGELWSAALTAPAFNWICSPVVTELETIVLDWLAQTLALPETFHSHGTGGGVIQGSASEAIVTVVVAARERYIRRQIEREGLTDEDAVEDRSCEIRAKLVALASDQAHSSTHKAANIAGTRIRKISTRRQDAYALRGADLRKKIEELISQGLLPYYLTVSIGATSTCAVDDLAEIADVAKDYPDIWIHCDAAYAGAALVLPEYQHLSKQLAFLDSFDMNMHKWLLTNFDASCLYVRKRRDLTDTLGMTPAYLKNQFTDSGLVTDYRDWQIPLGRRFRALKIWFVMRTWGVEGLQEHIRHHIALGKLFADLARSRGDIFSILSPPDFALTVLTVVPRNGAPPQNLSIADGGDPRPDQDSQIPVQPSVADEHAKAANSVTEKVYNIIDTSREYFLTSTVVGGVYAIRVVSANPLAEEKYIRDVFQKLVQATEKVLEEA
jgi:aromatic-L-amino-acid decarboxylase